MAVRKLHIINVKDPERCLCFAKVKDVVAFHPQINERALLDALLADREDRRMCYDCQKTFHAKPIR